MCVCVLKTLRVFFVYVFQHLSVNVPLSSCVWVPDSQLVVLLWNFENEHPWDTRCRSLDFVAWSPIGDLLSSLSVSRLQMHCSQLTRAPAVMPSLLS